LAKPIRIVKRHELTEEERQQQSMQELSRSLTAHQEALQQSLKLVQELHESGALSMVTALLESREKVAKIALGQVVKPAMTQTINNAMEVAGAASQLDPKLTKKVMGGVVAGMERAAEALDNGEKVGVFDLLKAMRDPGVNRALTMGLRFLQGMGEKL
jgi:uncharacterized protein YjgD (DUF1641 family)